MCAYNNHHNPTNRSVRATSAPKFNMGDLKKMTMAELTEMAHKMNIEGYSGLRKQDLIFLIFQHETNKNNELYGEGVIEVLDEGHGFLRSVNYN